jgi:hypothetical protein
MFSLLHLPFPHNDKWWNHELYDALFSLVTCISMTQQGHDHIILPDTFHYSNQFQIYRSRMVRNGALKKSVKNQSHFFSKSKFPFSEALFKIRLEK